MGFFSDLGKAVLEGAKEFSAESKEYYEEAMSIRDDRELLEEYKKAMTHSNMAKKIGYSKAAKARGLIRR